MTLVRLLFFWTTLWPSSWSSRPQNLLRLGRQAKPGIATMLALCSLSAAPWHALAAPVEVPDLKAWAALPAEQREQRRVELRQQLQQAAPQERRLFRQQLRERLENLDPHDRKLLAEQTRERWDAMSPEERQKQIDERRTRIEAMTPEQRRELAQQRRLMLDKLSAQERSALQEKLPAGRGIERVVQPGTERGPERGIDRTPRNGTAWATDQHAPEHPATEKRLADPSPAARPISDRATRQP